MMFGVRPFETLFENYLLLLEVKERDSCELRMRLHRPSALLAEPLGRVFHEQGNDELVY